MNYIHYRIKDEKSLFPTAARRNFFAQDVPDGVARKPEKKVCSQRLRERTFLLRTFPTAARRNRKKKLVPDGGAKELFCSGRSRRRRQETWKKSLFPTSWRRKVEVASSRLAYMIGKGSAKRQDAASTLNLKLLFPKISAIAFRT